MRNRSASFNDRMQAFVALRHKVPEADARELAELLQLRIEPPKKKPEKAAKPVDEVGRISASASDNTTTITQTDYPPEEKTTRFLYLDRITWDEEETQTATEPETPSVEAFIGKIESRMDKLPPLKPLLPWSRSWPVLHHLFRDTLTTRQLDMRAVTREAVAQRPLQRIPWQQRSRWPEQLIVVADFSRHLSPYFQDYLELARELKRWFQQRMRVIVCLDSERQVFHEDGRQHDRFPSLGGQTQILYLGDLGGLDQQGLSAAQWYFWGQALHREEHRLMALLTADPGDWDPALHRYFDCYHWDKQGLTPSTARRNHQQKPRKSQRETEDLLGFLSQAFELNAPMVRRARQALGLSVSVESRITQHPALTGNVQFFQWRDSQTQLRYQQKQDNERAWEIIQDYEANLPPELQIEQRHQSKRSFSADQNRFIHQLVASFQQGSLNKDDEDNLLGWIKRMVRRAHDDVRWQGNMEQLYDEYFQRRENNAAVPVGIDLARLPSSQQQTSEQSVRVMQQGQQLIVIPATETASGITLAECTLSFPADIRFDTTSNSDKKQVAPHQPISLPKDLQTAVLTKKRQQLHFKSRKCPDWAQGMGRDCFGVFVELAVKKVRFVMRWIPPGEFMMGSPEDEPERNDDEGPQHRVQIAQGFWLAETACSQALWKTVSGSNPSRFTENSDNPVERVDWKDVQSWIKSLNQQTGLHFRLPSEAQWEYACRAGTTTAFWFGNELSTDKANYDGNHPYNNGPKGEYREETVPVKSFQPNPWGLYQMHGNVWEWCKRESHGNYEGVSDGGQPWKKDITAIKHVVRGGSWFAPGKDLRSGFRGYSWDIHDVSSGFRLALGPKISSGPRVIILGVS